jgi:hypothetical protein
MNTVVSDTPRIIELQITGDSIVAHLADRRVISVSLAWSWRLSEAMPAQRSDFEFIGSGLGVHWPDIDEDISATRFVRHSCPTAQGQGPPKAWPETGPEARDDACLSRTVAPLHR